MVKQLDILFNIEKIKLEYPGQISHNSKHEILQLVIQGKTVGLRSIGRQHFLAEQSA